MEVIGIIGAGAWGTALATVAARAGHRTVIWAREAEVAEAINSGHENTSFLPGVAIDEDIRATSDLAAAAAEADVLLMAVPAQHMRAVSSELAGALADGAALVICAKGVEQGSNALMSEVLAETVPAARLAVLSGPTFAREVALGLPAAVTLACADGDMGAELVQALGQPMFRPYLSDDLIGAQIGGAVKNVLAIACGVIRGRELGENAQAALTTRGIAEIVRLGEAKGGRRETLSGLSGIGDLMLTCGSEQSRNMSLGAALGRGQGLKEILAARKTVAEGVFSAAAITALARELDVEMPVCAAVDSVLNGGRTIEEAMESLLSRSFKRES